MVFKKNHFFILRESKQVEESGRGKANLKQAPCTVWSPMWGLIPQPWDPDLSQKPKPNLTLNRLSQAPMKQCGIDLKTEETQNKRKRNKPKNEEQMRSLEMDLHICHQLIFKKHTKEIQKRKDNFFNNLCQNAHN